MFNHVSERGPWCMDNVNSPLRLLYTYVIPMKSHNQQSISKVETNQKKKNRKQQI